MKILAKANLETKFISECLELKTGVGINYKWAPRNILG